MKKGILCILLSILMVLPLFTACGGDSVKEETEVSIYTLYTITDEDTSPEAIREVELALNRILFYRLGVILDLHMVSEAEYDEYLAAKMTELEEFLAENEISTNDETNESLDQEISEEETEADSSAEGEAEEEGVVGPADEIISGDDVLKMLQENQDIVLKNPRVDIFLVRGYDNYYKLANDGKLAGLDSALGEGAGKALVQNIHPTLFQAAKVNGKTYGVPVNNAIGEYTYLVFDKELMDTYGIDTDTIKDLDDLQGYLAEIKANEPNVVPLKNVVDSSEYSYLLNNGFPAIIENGSLSSAYENANVQSYFSTIAKYNSLGYFANADATDDNTRYAVRIETGNVDDINEKLADTGYKYVYSRFSNPVATNETTLENIFCVGSHVVSDEFTKVIEILTEINTKDDLINLLTYGVEGKHYQLNEDGQVERITTNPAYIVSPEHIGNCFRAYTLEGENKNKWNNQIQQNLDSIASPSLGFTVTPYTSELKIEITDEEENVTTKVITIEEPDYVSLLNGVVDNYYPSLISGTAVQFDYETIKAEATAEAESEIVTKIDTEYEKILANTLKEQVKDDVIANQSEAIREQAVIKANNEYNNNVKKSLRNELKTKFTKENPDLTEEEINAMIEATLTDEYVAENRSRFYTDEEVAKAIDIYYNSGLTAAVNKATSELSEAHKQSELNKLKASDEYAADLKAMMDYKLPIETEKKINAKINALIAEYNNTIIAELNTVIETAINDMIAKLIEDNELDGEYDTIKEQVLLAIGYLETQEVIVEEGTEGDASTEGDTSTESDASTENEVSAAAETSTEGDAATDGEGTEDGEPVTETVIVEKYESWFDFVLKGKLQATYYALFGEPVTAA